MRISPKFRHLVIGVIAGWLSLFVLYPQLLILITSLLTRGEQQLIIPPFTLDNYYRLADPLYTAVLGHSLFMATVATLSCLLIGYPFALFLTTQTPARQQCLLLLLVIPFWTNSLVRLYAFKLLIGTKGVLNTLLLTLGLIKTPLKVIYTPLAVILGLVYILLPFMILPLYATLEKLDWSYLEAAKDLGANAWQRLIRIVLPLTFPGIVSGCLLVFLPAMGLFYVADLLGGAKHLLIGNVIKNQFLNARDWPFGAATSVSLTLLIGLLLLLYHRLSRPLHKTLSPE
jgi:spermidine/putrescine transport system permease protein